MNANLNMQRDRARELAQEAANAGSTEEAATIGTAAIAEALLYVGDKLRGETNDARLQLLEDLAGDQGTSSQRASADWLAVQVIAALTACPRDTDGDGDCGAPGCFHCRREALRAKLNAVAAAWQRVPVPPARATEAAGPPEIAREILSAVARTAGEWDGGMTSPIATTPTGGRMLVGYSGKRYTVMVEVDLA